MPFHKVNAGDRFGDRVFDLKTGVHLHKPEMPLLQTVAGIDDEFHGPGTAITDGGRSLDGSLAHFGAQGGRHAGRGGFLQHFLVATL